MFRDHGVKAVCAGALPGSSSRVIVSSRSPTEDGSRVKAMQLFEMRSEAQGLT